MRAEGEELERLIEEARELSWRHHGRKIRFYAPGFVHYETPYFSSSPHAFPSITVTGRRCALGCEHCQGRILETMIPATTPKRLIGVCRKIKERGGVGCLISGGCLPDGSVPLDDFVDAMAEVKRSLGLTVVVHTGLIKEATARRLRGAGIDAALIDVIGSDETIREVYRLDARVGDYDRSLRALYEAGIPTVPHVLVGLYYGRLKGELRSLEMIAKYRPAAVIVIALIPIEGTPMGRVEPPSPEDVSRVLVAARFMMPGETPIVLGCARPRGEHRARTDRLAVRGGVNAIAFPSVEAIRLAEEMGLETSFSPLCCSQVFADAVSLHAERTEGVP